MDNESELQNEPTVKVSFEDKARIEREYRSLLVDDLLNSRTRFSAGPYEAHIQFSNFCNMSCIMCWDGNNPPTKKTDPDLLRRIGEQVGPHLSIVTPYSGSEPLVLTWDETRNMAEEYGILLCITTNVQYLDEKKFHELKDITETLILSIDSHIPAVFEKIRPRGNSKKVFANLETSAQLCVEHNLECMVNIVFLTQNAPMLTDTLNYLADIGIQNVNLIQLLDVNGNSRMYDPLLHYSEEYIAWIKRNSIATAKQRKLRLIWSIAGYAEFDFREPGFVPLKKRKAWNDEWDEKMKRLFPRFCRNAYGRLRIDSEGDVSPCCYATQGELSLGNIGDQDFDVIWNSTEAQDLRRGMFSGDVPALCQSCRYHDLIDPFFLLPFMEQEESEFAKRFNVGSKQAIASLEIVGPAHGLRATDAIEFSIRQPNLSVEQYVIALSLGGETDEIHRETLEPVSNSAGVLRFKLSAELWIKLNTNVGYWWMIWAIPADRSQQPVRCEETRCLIRHQPMPRIDGSKLRYRDQGFVPVSDLGGNKREGWQDPNHLPARPVAAFHGREDKNQLADTDSQPEIIHLQASAPTTNDNSGKGLLKRWFGTQVESGIRDAYLEVISQQTNELRVSGWILLKNGAADQVELIGDGGGTVLATVIQRDDIAAAYPKLDSACNSGFEATLSDEKFWHNDRYRFTIVAKQNGRVAFRCLVTCRGGQNGAGAAHRIRNGILEV